MSIDPREFALGMTLPVRQALAAVRWLDGRVRNLRKPDEETLEKAALTDADCVSQEVLLVALRERWPDVALEGEEDTPTAAAFAANRSRDRVVIDPIDGTLRYLRGDGHYAIVVGLEHARAVRAALIAIPRADVLIRAVRGEGAEISRAGGPFEPLRLGNAAGQQVLVSHGLPDRARGRLTAAGLKPVLAAGGAIGVAPLLADTLGGIRIMHGARGMSRRAWIASLPTLEAGGSVEALDGPLPDAFRPRIRGMLVAATREVVRDLREMLAD